LNEMAAQAAAGKIGPGTYNPAVHSVSAKAKKMVKDAASTAKSAAKQAYEGVVPDAMQDAGSGILAGLGGLGDVARLLPLVVVVGAGVYAYRTMKN